MYKYKISYEDIEHVSKPKSKYLDNEENRLIYLLSKYVLTISMLSNNSDEVGLILNVRDSKFRYWFKGNSKSVTIPLQYLRNKNLDLKHSFIIVHNHPSNSGFSMRDLISFFDSNTLYILVAVQNNGSLHILKKFRDTNNYSDWITDRFNSAGDYIKYIRNTNYEDIIYEYRRFKI